MIRSQPKTHVTTVTLFCVFCAWAIFQSPVVGLPEVGQYVFSPLDGKVSYDVVVVAHILNYYIRLTTIF